MNQELDLDYINEEKLINEIDRNDNLLNNVEQDLVTLEHYRALSLENRLMPHHVKALGNISLRYQQFNPSLESITVSLEKNNAAGYVLTAVILAAIAGMIMFISAVIAFVVKLFTGGGKSSSSSSTANTGPMITWTFGPATGSGGGNHINRRLQESLKNVDDFLGNNDLGRMSLIAFNNQRQSFLHTPKELYDKTNKKYTYDEWHKSTTVYYVYYDIFNAWTQFTRLEDIRAVSTLSDMVKKVAMLVKEDWIPTSIFVNAKDDKGLFTNIPLMLTNQMALSNNTRSLEQNLTKLIRFDNTINSYMSRGQDFGTVAKYIKDFKEEADDMITDADKIYANATQLATSLGAIQWFKNLDSKFIENYNSSVEFNKNRIAKGVENISRNVTKNKGKDYANSVESFFNKCRAMDSNLEENADKWNSLTTEFGKIVPNTVSRFMRAYLQYAKMFVVMGRLSRAWNKFTDDLDRQHNRLIALQK
jgi:hypothetical protein